MGALKRRSTLHSLPINKKVRQEKREKIEDKKYKETEIE